MNGQLVVSFPADHSFQFTDYEKAQELERFSPSLTSGYSNVFLFKQALKIFSPGNFRIRRTFSCVRDGKGGEGRAGAECNGAPKRSEALKQPDRFAPASPGQTGTPYY